MRRVWCLCVLMAVAAVTAPAAAHHSFSMFDQTRQVTLKGTVKEFQWTNPHSWLQLKVQNANGEVEDWAIEMLSPNVLSRMGWKRNSVQAGDDVTVTIHPVRSGAHGGNMLSVADKNGRQVGGTQP